MSGAELPFTSILCGVEGNPASTEAIRQAIFLAEPGAALHFIAVYTSFELGPDYEKERLRERLREAVKLATEAGVSASTMLGEGRYAVDALLDEGKNHDLLVLGTQGKSRVSGIVAGSTASEAAHSTEGPLLIAREPPGDASVVARILLASDGLPGSWAPARTAARIAKCFDATVEVVHARDEEDSEPRAVVEAQIAEIRKLTGEDPVLIEPSAHATQAITQTAEENSTSLVVCGRQGLTGIKALGSVSERVVHAAPCSVLLVPGAEDSASK